MPDGATHKLAEISNQDLPPTGSILNLDLSDYISPATTLRIVALGALTSADILKIDEISVSIEQPETLAQTHHNQLYELGDENLAIAKSGQIQNVNGDITGLTLKLLGATDGDSFESAQFDGINLAQENTPEGTLIRHFTGWGGWLLHHLSCSMSYCSCLWLPGKEPLNASYDNRS